MHNIPRYVQTRTRTHTNYTHTYTHTHVYIWKQRCEHPRFGQSPFATFLHESTHPEKKYGCTCHFNIASPTGTPQEQIPYTKLDSITENRKNKKKQKKTKIPEKGWGAHSCWIFFFFFLFFLFSLFFLVFVFFWWFCLLYRLSIGVVLPWKCFLHCCRSLLPYSAILFH